VEAAETEAGVDADGGWTDDDHVDVLVRTCVRRLKDGGQCSDDYSVVKMMKMMMLMLFWPVLVTWTGPCLDVHV
jgi:hypothetical protein